LIATPNGLIAAKDISVGDTVYSVRLEQIPNESSTGGPEFDYDGFASPTLASTSGLVEVTITSAVLSQKDTVMFFNNEQDKKFSLEQPMFIKRDGSYEIIPSGGIQEGDFLLKINESGNIIETLVETVTQVAELSSVYKFGCEPEDWFIAGGYLVHNK